MLNNGVYHESRHRRACFLYLVLQNKQSFSLLTGQEQKELFISFFHCGYNFDQISSLGSFLKKEEFNQYLEIDPKDLLVISLKRKED